MPAPVNKKVDKKFTERLKKAVEKNPTMFIRKTVKVFVVDEKTVRRTLKTLGKVSLVKPFSQRLRERLRALRLERSKKLLNCLKSYGPSMVKIFSDVKIFNVDCSINRRNDRFIV